MSYTKNMQWSNPDIPKADGLWVFNVVRRDPVGRPCAMCGAFTKYLHEMLHPVDLKVLVGCTCHAQLLGIPYAEAEQYERNLKKEEKIALRLAKQKALDDAHELEVVNGGLCSEGLRCPKCRQRVEQEKREAAVLRYQKEAKEEQEKIQRYREEQDTILLRWKNEQAECDIAREKVQIKAVEGGGCGISLNKYPNQNIENVCGIDGKICNRCWGKKNGGCGTFFKDVTCWYSTLLCGGKNLCPDCVKQLTERSSLC